MAKKAATAGDVRVVPDAPSRARGPGWGCAENCLKEILLRRGIQTGVREIADLVKAPAAGASFADLARAAEAKGLKAAARKLTVEKLEEALLSGEGPCIVHLSWGEGDGHFSVAEAHEGHVRLIDPPRRVWNSPGERLREAFTGYALFLKPA